MSTSGYPQLSLRADTAVLPELGMPAIVNIQQMLFDASGVLAPIVHQEEDKRPTIGNAELWLDEKLLGTFRLDDPNDLPALLLRQAADLLTPRLVDHYLNMLHSKLPVLVATVRERIALDALTIELQGRLRNNETIHDLPRILEELLVRDLGFP